MSSRKGRKARRKSRNSAMPDASSSRASFMGGRCPARWCTRWCDAKRQWPAPAEPNEIPASGVPRVHGQHCLMDAYLGQGAFVFGVNIVIEQQSAVGGAVEPAIRLDFAL